MIVDTLTHLQPLVCVQRAVRPADLVTQSLTSDRLEVFKISGLAERIKYIRNQKGLSQAKFATIIGASQGNVGDWERGKTLPGAAALLSIIKRFNISADWLLMGETAAQGIPIGRNLFVPKDTLSEEEQILIAGYRQLPERWKGHIEGVIAAHHIHKSD